MKEDIQNGTRWLEPQEALELANKILAGEYDQFGLANLLVQVYAAGNKNGIHSMAQGLLEAKSDQVGMGAS